MCLGSQQLLLWFFEIKLLHGSEPLKILFTAIVGFELIPYCYKKFNTTVGVFDAEVGGGNLQRDALLVVRKSSKATIGKGFARKKFNVYWTLLIGLFCTLMLLAARFPFFAF